MSIKQDILSAVTAAMKSGESEKRDTLRMVLSAMKEKEIEIKGELDDEKSLAVIARQVKQLQDAIKDFTKGNRDDLVQKAQAEVSILEAYLPKQLSDEELGEIVKKVFDGLNDEEKKQIGQVMGAVMAEVKGKADGNRVRKALEKLNS